MLSVYVSRLATLIDVIIDAQAVFDINFEANFFSHCLEAAVHDNDKLKITNSNNDFLFEAR